MHGLPSGLILNFLNSEFQIKKTSDPLEVRINSIYKSDTKFHCYINISKFVFTDFKAGISNNLFVFFKDYLNVYSDNDVISYIIKNYGSTEQKIQLEENKEIDTSKEIKDFLSKDKPVFFGSTDKLGIFGKICLKYVESRKINKKFIDRMGYVFNEGSRYNGRIIIPYFENNEFVYFQARDINKESTLRYLNPDKIDTKEFVFNIDDINEELIICEGPFDAMSVDEQIATCMSSGDIGVKQLTKIFSKHPKDIIYVPDEDETGKNKMDVNINKIIQFCSYSCDLNIYVFHVPKGCKDLNDMKVKTSKNFILKKECEIYKKNSFRDFNFSKKNSIF